MCCARRGSDLHQDFIPSDTWRQRTSLFLFIYRPRTHLRPHVGLDGQSSGVHLLQIWKPSAGYYYMLDLKRRARTRSRTNQGHFLRWTLCVMWTLRLLSDFEPSSQSHVIWRTCYLPIIPFECARGNFPRIPRRMLRIMTARPALTESFNLLNI